MLKLAVLVCVCVGLMHGYPGFVELIPNGNKVPNPCTAATDDTWSLVGHDFATRKEFMAARDNFTDKYLNVFGEMFNTNGQDWAAICNLDADKDGKTNGAELGDPDCTWSIGMDAPELPTGHPGICEVEVPGCLSTLSEICPQAP